MDAEGPATNRDLFRPKLRWWHVCNRELPRPCAGLRANDLIVGINGKRLYQINGIDDFLREIPSTPIHLNVRRKEADLTLPFEPGPLVVGDVSKDGPASRAGLQEKDVVRAIDGIPMKSTTAASEYIRHHGGQPVRFSIVRNGKDFDLEVTPEIPPGRTASAHRHCLG